MSTNGPPAGPGTREASIEAPGAVEVLRPGTHAVPLVFASPHSGRRYPPEFVAASRLDPVALRRSEDAYVDEIFAGVVAGGAPLVRALFPRAYVDPNREPFELDPAMFADPLPDYVNTRSPRVAAGLGTVARVVTNGEEIYRAPLRFADALDRIRRFYRPYHRALEAVIEETRRRFGTVLLVDCHSMPSVGGPMDRDPGRHRVDFVLGDRRGASCRAEVVDALEAYLRRRGYRVTRNEPYAGGFTTGHYGRPDRGVQAVQIEINRAIYMNEETMERRAEIAALAEEMSGLVPVLAGALPGLGRAAE